jgi:type VI secretion system protein ImpF
VSRSRAESILVPSILDRLLDDDPAATREVVRSRTQQMRELKQSLRRDLENLLNTRRSWLAWPDDLTELDRSVLDYGLPDLTSAVLSTPEGRERFCSTIEAAIRTFEPRLLNVRVELLDSSEPLDRTLRFRIDALLRAEPAPEPIVFDSALEPGTGAVQVRGGDQ